MKGVISFDMRRKINYDIGTTHSFYEQEIQEALDWLIQVRDQEQHGWAWVQFIRPNEQNTAEVVHTLLNYIDELEEEKISLIVESVNEWLINPQNHARITIDYSWVLIALVSVLNCKYILPYFENDVLISSVAECTRWLLNNQQDNGGWADNPQEKTSTIRTSLAIYALNRVLEFNLSNNIFASLIRETEISVKKGVGWLLEAQNHDGGWGNIRECDVDWIYQKKVELSYADLKFQCETNAASTGYALLALSSQHTKKQASAIKKAKEAIYRLQKSNGSWDVFIEVGIRDEKKFTFRHFGTTWALTGLVLNGDSDFSDESVMEGLNYLIQLQDRNYGGWRCSLDADNYTWATCNALDTIKLVKKQITEVYSRDFMKIIFDWWRLKKKEANFSFAVRNIIFSFNAPMGFIFCVCFSVMMLLVVAAVHFILSSNFQEISELINGTIIVVSASILGIPWIIWVQNVFHKEMDSWINSIGWVYGIITGFIVVFYQYLV